MAEHNELVDPENFHCPRCGLQESIEPLPGSEVDWICYLCDKPFQLKTWLVWDDEAKKMNYLEQLLPKKE